MGAIWLYNVSIVLACAIYADNMPAKTILAIVASFIKSLIKQVVDKDNPSLYFIIKYLLPTFEA